MALADVYDALRSKRRYKKCFTHEECIKLIQEEKGKHFDPVIVEAFIKHNKIFEKLSLELSDNGQV